MSSPGAGVRNAANALSSLRLAIVPLFAYAIVSAQDTIALALFVFATATDVVDGYIARRLSATSRIGAVLDPVADWLIITAAFVGLAATGRIPAWVVVPVVGRVVLIINGWAYLVGAGQASVPPSRLSGKITAWSQSIFVIVVLMGVGRVQLPLLGVVLTTITLVSIMDYAFQASRLAAGASAAENR